MFEDINLERRPVLKSALGVMNKLFAIIFTVEMLLKILGMGFVGYFSNLWNCLDSFIVAVSCCRVHSILYDVLSHASSHVSFLF